MNQYISAAVIKELREKKKLTQAQLAEMLHVSDKTVSKWETARGLPDITFLEPLAAALGVSVAELLTGNCIANQNKSSNLMRSSVYVCPICGNIVHSVGQAMVSCCGVALPALEAEPDQLYLSGLHNHHSASIARRVLGTGYQMPEEIQSLSFPSSIVRTGSRRGLEVSGESEEYVRNIRVMKLGKSLFIHDFSSNQYHSYLYGKHFEVRSRRCVITEKGVSGIDREGYPYSLPFIFHRDSSTGNGSLTLSHVTLGERTVFVNPYYPLEMNDDEIAMARMLELYDMGEDVYPFREGVADARLGRLL